MTVLRQNTDYAFRVMVNLSRRWSKGVVSARMLAQEEDVAYQFACKILQVLHDAKLVESSMGPKGGYSLSRPPNEITMLDVITAAQGPLGVNRCMLGVDQCSRSPVCSVTGKLAQLQQSMESFLEKVTLEELMNNKCSGETAEKFMAQGDQNE
jgi:Rrf2 family protein